MYIYHSLDSMEPQTEEETQNYLHQLTREFSLFDYNKYMSKNNIEFYGNLNMQFDLPHYSKRQISAIDKIFGSETVFNLSLMMNHQTITRERTWESVHRMNTFQLCDTNDSNEAAKLDTIKETMKFIAQFGFNAWREHVEKDLFI